MITKITIWIIIIGLIAWFLAINLGIFRKAGF